MIYLDVDMVIDQIDTEDLEAEIKNRRRSSEQDVDDSLHSLCWLALRELRRGDHEEAELILERALRPVFPDRERAERALAAARGKV